MNILMRATKILFSVAFFFVVSSNATAHSENSNTHMSLVFQVEQSRIKFDSSTVQSAKLVDAASTQQPLYGLELKLKAAATKKMRTLTHHSIGKQSNILLNGRVVSSAVIQSELGGELQFFGLTKEEVEQFINSLKK